MALGHRTAPAPAALPPAERPGPLTRPAAVALVAAQVAFVPFALWHGSLDTPDSAAMLSVVQDGREGWYWLHYGTVACLLTTAVALAALASWGAGPRRRWAVAAAVLLLLGAMNLAMVFGTEAVGFYHLADPELVDPATATRYLEALSRDPRYGVLIGLGLLGTVLGQVAAVRVLAAHPGLPVPLRRLLPLAVVLDVVKISVPFAVGGPLAVVAAAVWVGLGVAVLRAVPATAARSG